MLTSTMPVAGIVVALFAAAASVSATALTAGVLAEHYSPLHLGLLYLPEVAGAVITAVAARHRHHQARDPLSAAGRHGVPRRRDRCVPDRGSLEPGADAGRLGADRHRARRDRRARRCSSPASRCPPANLQRVFAIVELMRAVAAFMIAPIFAHFAATVGGSLDAGTGIALWIGLGLASRRRRIGVAIYALGGARPQTPDIDRFLAGEAPAWYSPPLLARVRPGLSAAHAATESATDMASTDASA